MSWFAIFGILFTGVFLGYMIGHDCGEAEGYLKGVSEEYKTGRGR